MEELSLSPAMIKAIKESFEDGTITGAGVRTEVALITRRLAVEVRGTTTRRNRFSQFEQTVYNAYLGARLNEAGHELRTRLLALDNVIHGPKEE